MRSLDEEKRRALTAGTGRRFGSLCCSVRRHPNVVLSGAHHLVGIGGPAEVGPASQIRTRAPPEVPMTFAEVRHGVA